MAKGCLLAAATSLSICLFSIAQLVLAAYPDVWCWWLPLVLSLCVLLCAGMVALVHSVPATGVDRAIGVLGLLKGLESVCCRYCLARVVLLNLQHKSYRCFFVICSLFVHRTTNIQR